LEPMNTLEILKGAALGEMAYDAYHDEWCNCADRIEQINVEMSELEDLLIDLNAPGWVAT